MQSNYIPQLYLNEKELLGPREVFYKGRLDTGEGDNLRTPGKLKNYAYPASFKNTPSAEFQLCLAQDPGIWCAIELQDRWGIPI